MAKRAYFLVKSEPSVYSFDAARADGGRTWDGVRNFEARNNLRAMKKGDELLLLPLERGQGRGGDRACRPRGLPRSHPDEDWSVVDIEPVKALKRPVTLDEMRADKLLGKMMIFRRSRLSVVPVTDAEFEAVVALGSKKASSSPSS